MTILKPHLTCNMSELKDIRLIATDLDGTLLDNNKYLSEANLEALLACIDRDIVVVVATGRSVRSVPQVIRDIEGIRYHITSNGSKTFELLPAAESLDDHEAIGGRTAKLLRACYIDPVAVKKLEHLIADHDLMCEVFYDGTPYVAQACYDDPVKYGIPDYFTEYIYKSRKPVPDIYELTEAHIAEIENINFLFPNERTKKMLADELSGNDMYELTSSLPFNYEVGGKGVSKAAAIGFLCEHLGIDMRQTMCIGDNVNDVSMIKAAGIGVAMGNAVPEAKAAADFVTDSSESDGVALAIAAIIGK